MRSQVWLAVSVLVLTGGPWGEVAAQGTADSNQREVPFATKLLPDSLPGGSKPSTMVRDALHREATKHFARWRTAYEARVEPDEIAAHQEYLQQEFLRRIGGLPPRGPLRPQVTGTLERTGYTVEKVLFESEPQFYVTAGLFLPDPEKFPPPWPAVVIACGHSAEGKLQAEYQTGAALAALNGLAAMIVDPVGQGERMQLLREDGRPAFSEPTTEHTLLGTGAILVGWNTARWMIHDAMAAIDYLQSREDIRGDRIGCMGNSGGGTQTCYLMALDERVTAAAPSCYVTSFKRLLETIGPQDAEQNIFGQIALGMDHADYLMMRAPKPTMINCATRDFFDIGGTWAAFRDAKRFFQRLDAGRNIELVEVDATHGWHPMLRRASVHFMVQHLTGRVGDLVEPEIVPLTAEEMNVTPEGQVLKLAGAISAFDQVRLEAKRLAAERQTAALAPEALRQAVRQVVGIRTMAELASPEVERRKEFRVGNVAYQPLVFQVEDGIWLPAVLARPAESKPEGRTVTCLAMSEGKESVLGSDGELQQRVADGETVLAIDLRGVGETLPDKRQRWYDQRFGANGGNSVRAYLLGKSLVGMRAEDCLVVARWLAAEEGVDRIELVASGELTTPALHAAAIEPSMFGGIELRRGLRSWADVTATPHSENQVAGLVHQALSVYDLPDLAALVGERLVIRDPYDATDKPASRFKETALPQKPLME